MVDYDQDAGESCKDILKTKDGIDRLALYHSSVGRFLLTLLVVSFNSSTYDVLLYGYLGFLMHLEH